MYHLYADDLQLYIQFLIDEYLIACNNVNSDLTDIISFSKGHNLALNIEKTQPIIIGSPKYIARLESEGVRSICINGIAVPFCSNVVNLGITFDSTLCWDKHSTNVINRVFSTLAQVRRNFTVLPTDIRKRIVQSLIMPIFDYGNVLFSDIPITTNIKLQRAQNACIRFITGGSKYDHITPRYIEVNMLKLAERRLIAQAILLWKIIKYKCPGYLHKKFTFMSSVHTRENRHTNKMMQLPNHRTEKYAKSFLVATSKLWNEHNINSYMHYQTFQPLRNDLFRFYSEAMQ